MKKKLIIVVVILSLIVPSMSMAAPPDFFGGVSNEYLYEEVVFITGVPIKFIGAVKISIKDKGDTSSVTYKAELGPHPEYSIRLGLDAKTKYKKTVTYDTKYQNYVGIGQTTSETTVGKSSETLEVKSLDGVDNVKFELEEYLFSKSDSIDSRPAADFYSGDLNGMKKYLVTGDVSGKKIEGTVRVDINGTTSGYENFWGSTETQAVANTISSNIREEKKEGDTGEGNTTPSDNKDEDKKNSQPIVELKKWTGTVTSTASEGLAKKLQYSANNANHSSIEGAYTKVTNEESVSKYRYNLPRGSGTINLGLKNLPKLERLIVPKFRDVNGHWAEDNIKKLYSLNVFDGSESIFSPDTAMSRLDFAKAVVRSCDIRSQEESKKRKRKEPKEESLFADVAVENPEYQYVKSGVEKSIIEGYEDGNGNRIFEPDKDLTRAQAITILIRALGFENRAPNPGYSTSFQDDKRIPNWAKDSIYMAKEIGLIQGDSTNRVNPDKVLSRAEASTMVVNFLKFLEDDLQKDYRENIINFN